MKLYKEIDKLLVKEKVIIAIDGPSGSGKSTLANELSLKYDGLIIHIDDFFLPEKMKTKARLAEIGGNFHYERFIEEIIDYLDKDDINYRKFNCKDGTFEDVNVKSTKVIIIEGCYSHHSLLKPHFDLLVYLDVDYDNQLKRIKQRSGEFMLKRFIDEWIPLENKYFRNQQIKENADIVINQN